MKNIVTVNTRRLKSKWLQNKSVLKHVLSNHEEAVTYLGVHFLSWRYNATSRATVKKKWKNCFHDNFLISQPNPMMWPSLKSSRRDDFNEGHIIGFDWEMRKLSWKQFFHYFLTVALQSLTVLLNLSFTTTHRKPKFWLLKAGGCWIQVKHICDIILKNLPCWGTNLVTV